MEDFKFIVVLSSWSSGSSAVAGYIEKLGAYSCPPNNMTDDERTPNTYEPKDLSIALKQVIDEPQLVPFKDDYQVVFKAWFAEWIKVRKEDAIANGKKAIILKYPTTAFFIQEIYEVCDPHFIIVNRNRADIEDTRKRRGWSERYGLKGAEFIYSKIYSQMIDHNHDALMVSFRALKATKEFVNNCAILCNSI